MLSIRNKKDSNPVAATEQIAPMCSPPDDEVTSTPLFINTDELENAEILAPENPFCAANEVLETPELLELILCQMSPHDLLCRAQRVAYLWRDIIKTCSRIQQMLWLKPWSEADCEKEGFTVNPFALAHLRRDHDESANDEEMHTYEGNIPIVFADKDSRTSFELDWSPVKDTPINASWRQMLSTQPRVPQLFTYERRPTDFWDGFCYVHEYLHNEIGSCLGAIYNEVWMLEDHVCTVKTRTMIRPYIESGHAVDVQVIIKPLHSDADLFESCNQYWSY